MFCKLIWETGEWDPVGGDSDEGWSVGEDSDDDDDGMEGVQPTGRRTLSGEKGQRMARGRRDGDGDGNGDGNGERQGWQRREMELVDGTREVGFWVEGKEARVRVERRSLV